MTLTLAVAGKSGSGKTTVAKNIAEIFRKIYPSKSMLILDNDLSFELSRSYGKDIRKTIYGIRSGKHEYKTGIPENMSKHEFIEWALEDIIEPIDENTDIIVSWLTGSKDCRCPITKQMNDALVKLISRYDIAIFDCEFDLKYLAQLVDIPMDVTLIVVLPTEESVSLASRIADYSAKYAAGAQMGVVLNKVNESDIPLCHDLAEKYELEILGTIPKDEDLWAKTDKASDKIQNAIMKFIPRLNIPQGAGNDCCY